MLLSVGKRRFRWCGKKWSNQVFYTSQLSPEILALDMWEKIFLKENSHLGQGSMQINH